MIQIPREVKIFTKQQEMSETQSTFFSGVVKTWAFLNNKIQQLLLKAIAKYENCVSNRLIKNNFKNLNIVIILVFIKLVNLLLKKK